MKVYVSTTSPFTRKIRVALIETGMDAQIETEIAVNTPVNPHEGVASANPLGKIPCLVLDDGSSIYDSRVITRYLDQMSGGKLFPQGDALWKALVLEATVDGMLDASVLLVYENLLRPEDKRSEEWKCAQWLKISRSLDHIEADWTDYLDGPFDMPKIALACALGYFDFRMADRNWREGRPRLAAWEEQVKSRPSLTSTVPHT